MRFNGGHLKEEQTHLKSLSIYLDSMSLQHLFIYLE